MPIYRKSAEAEVIYIRVPVSTAMTIAFYGSADGYAEPNVDFGTDETIMVSGTVVADDGADLSMRWVDVYLNGGFLGSAGLSYDINLGVNFYQYTLGLLAEGDYTVETKFGRYKVR